MENSGRRFKVPTLFSGFDTLSLKEEKYRAFHGCEACHNARALFQVS